MVCRRAQGISLVPEFVRERPGNRHHRVELSECPALGPLVESVADTAPGEPMNRRDSPPDTGGGSGAHHVGPVPVGMNHAEVLLGNERSDFPPFHERSGARENQWVNPDGVIDARKERMVFSALIQDGDEVDLDPAGGQRPGQIEYDLLRPAHWRGCHDVGHLHVRQTSRR
jgi:hypothetical protein